LNDNWLSYLDLVQYFVFSFDIARLIVFQRSKYRKITENNWRMHEAIEILLIE
jgi:hypothetical protein